MPAATSPSLVVSPSLHVFVHVCECVFLVDVCDGQQSIQWLAQKACHVYQQHHYHTRGQLETQAQYTPSNVTDEQHNSYYPQQIIEQHIQDKQHIYITLHTEKQHRQTLWSLLSGTSPYHYRSIILECLCPPTGDPSGPVPALLSNLTGWRVAIPMRLHRRGIYRIQLDLPIHATLCWVFIVGNTVTLSEQYITCRDQWGNTLHTLTVERPAPDYHNQLQGEESFFHTEQPHLPCWIHSPTHIAHKEQEKEQSSESGTGVSNVSELSAFHPSQLVTGEEDNPVNSVLSISLTGHYLGITDSVRASIQTTVIHPTTAAPQPQPQQGVVVSTTTTVGPTTTAWLSTTPASLAARQLDTHLSHLYLSDIVTGETNTQLLREALTKHYTALLTIYSSYRQAAWCADSQVGLTRLEFISLCRICRIPDKRVTIQRVNTLFSTVLEHSSSGLPVTSALATAATASVFATSQSLSVHDFFSLLIRIAVVKFKTNQAGNALDSLCARHLLPFASLYNLPPPVLQGRHHQQQQLLIGNTTQEREREKERNKEKLLYAGILDPQVMAVLKTREEQCRQLFTQLIQTQTQTETDNSNNNTQNKTTTTTTTTSAITTSTTTTSSNTSGNNPSGNVYDSAVSLSSFLSVLSSHRWWSFAASDLLCELWQDESMDEKQTAKEKEIENAGRDRDRDRAERTTQGGQAGQTGGQGKEDRPLSTYRQVYAEWLLFLVKLAERWTEQQQQIIQQQQHQQQQQQRQQQTVSKENPDSSNEDGVDDGPREVSNSLFPPGASSSTGDRERDISVVGDEDSSLLRREERNRLARLRQQEREQLEDIAYHRLLVSQMQSFFSQLFPSRAEQARLAALDALALAEATAKEQSLKAAAAAQEKADRLAASKNKRAEAANKEDNAKQVKGKAKK